MATSVATPLALGAGVGSELRRPLGMAVIAGAITPPRRSRWWRRHPEIATIPARPGQRPGGGMARCPLHRCLLLLALTVVQPAAAGLLHATFQDHAVLQREAPIPVWGSTTPGAMVTVTLGASRISAHAGPDGRWQTTLPALPAGGPYTLTAASSAGTRETVGDILIGDVFLCSGQSNMEYPTRLA
jgi:hypothetical protein